jgi:hypothetical protein
MILTGSFMILLGSILFAFTGAEGVILVAAALLAIGLVGTWIGDRRRDTISVPNGAVETFRSRADVGRLTHDRAAAKHT